MHIRPRTRRRLLFLFTLAGLAFALLSVVFVYSQHRNAIAIAALRAQAMAAFKAGDYEKSVRLLAEYHDKSTEPDAEALFDYAKSRSLVAADQEPAGAHIADSIRLFKQYLETKPDDSAAQHELVKLYVQAGYYPEAARLADEILAKNAGDTEVLWQEVFAQVGQHRADLALVTCQKLNELEPLNISAQKETLQLMSQTNVPANQVIEHADRLREEHDGDPRFEVLMAEAYLLAKQQDSAKKWLQTASTHTPTDATFVVAMVSALDDAELYNDAAAFLSRSAEIIPDAGVQRLLAQRLWQNRDLNQLETRLQKLDPASASADGTLLGYRALALYADGKETEAAALVSAMSHRSDPAATAWAIALSTKFAAPTPTPTQAMGRFSQALARDPQNPVVHLMLAEAYLNEGESELAIQECNQAYSYARSWAMPHVVAVEALLASGRTGDAVRTAEEAVDRAPGNYLAETALAKAHFALAEESGLASDYARVAPEFEKIQKAWHNPQTAWMYVTALARSGKTYAATTAVKNLLSGNDPLPITALTKLAEVADSEKLDVQQAVFDAAEKAGGLTPEIAFLKARAMLEDGKDADGLEFLLKAGKGHENELPWREVVAGYREMCRPTEALKDWITLGDQYPGDLRLQQNILRANSRVNDRAFWSRTIDRVKTLTGEQGILWRIERGRLLLAGDPSERDKAEAVNLLTQVTHIAPALAEPHRLLAFAMEKVGNPAGAIGELTAAADARPEDYATTRELVRLLLTANRTAEARSRLDTLASNTRLSHDGRTWLVQMYVDEGANDKALSLLSSETGPAAQEVQHQRILAELYRRLGRGDDAAKIYQSLLDKPVKDAALLAGAADFFASMHDMPTAEKFMAKFAELPLKPGELEVEQAEFAEQWIGLEQAFDRYKAATQAAPLSEVAWQNIVSFFMRRDRFSDAIKWADQGLGAIPSNPTITALRKSAATMASLGGAQDFQLLIEAICRHPQDSGTTEMLDGISSVTTAKLSPLAATKFLRDIADRYPQNLPVQGQAVQSYLASGQVSEALELAQKLAVDNPNSPLPQRLLANIYAMSADWAKAEQATLLWREHSMDHPMAADVQLAEIYLRQPKRNAAGAVRALEPHLSSNAPARSPLLFELYLKALVQADRSNDVAALLKPLVNDSAKWRIVWLELAPLQKDAAEASNWIKQLTDLVPQTVAVDPVGLATAWYNVGTQFDSPPAIDASSQVIEPLLKDTKDAQVWMVEAEIAHAKGDLAAAENWYRKVLGADPHSAKAMNNLAYVLWLENRDQDMAEAQKLAESAVAQTPGDANFYDTLARIEMRSGNTQGALANFHHAIQKDPASVEAMIGLAALLARDPSTRAQARELIAQIQRLLEVNPRLPSVLRQQYQAAQEAVASSL